MKNLVILGSGAAGTMVAAKMRKKLAENEWKITVIDRDIKHHYQPGWLFVPFGIYTLADCIKPKTDFVPRGVDFVLDEITNIDPAAKKVTTKKGSYSYDWLVVSTGCRIAPDEIDGLTDDWGGAIHNFYTPDGAQALCGAMHNFKKGRLVFNIAEMPIKCPVAPLEFVYMADWFFAKRGLRQNIEIELVTPLTGAFRKRVSASSRIAGSTST